MAYLVDVELLASLVRKQRGTMTLREAAEAITHAAGPISSATVMRVEQKRLPDLPVFLHLCNWLQVPPARLLYSVPPAPRAAGDVAAGDVVAGDVVVSSDTAAAVVRLLRADKRLEPAMANVLAIMVEATYAQLATPKI